MTMVLLLLLLLLLLLSLLLPLSLMICGAGVISVDFMLTLPSIVARALWNNLLQPVGRKTNQFIPDAPFLCPSEELPYLATAANSVTHYHHHGGNNVERSDDVNEVDVDGAAATATAAAAAAAASVDRSLSRDFDRILETADTTAQCPL